LDISPMRERSGNNGRSARSATNLRLSRPPHLVGDLPDEGELGPLLLLREFVALLGGGEPALRRQADALDFDEARSFLDAPLDRVLGFELAGLAGDKPEHRKLWLGQMAQRLEATRTLAVILQEISVNAFDVKQPFGNRLVAAGGRPSRAE